MREDRLPAVASEPLILLPNTVQDVDDFASHPEQYLVSLYAEPQRGAGLWRERLKRHPYGSEGLLRLSYLETGTGVTSFPGPPVEVELRRVRAGAVFGINGDRVGRRE